MNEIQWLLASDWSWWFYWFFRPKMQVLNHPSKWTFAKWLKIDSIVVVIVVCDLLNQILDIFAKVQFENVSSRKLRYASFSLSFVKSMCWLSYVICISSSVPLQFYALPHSSDDRSFSRVCFSFGIFQFWHARNLHPFLEQRIQNPKRTQTIHAMPNGATDANSSNTHTNRRLITNANERFLRAIRIYGERYLLRLLYRIVLILLFIIRLDFDWHLHTWTREPFA